MPRPTASQISLGACAVVLLTVGLLAVSGANSVLGISLLVVAVLVAGALVTAYSVAGPWRRARARAAREATPGARASAGSGAHGTSASGEAPAASAASAGGEARAVAGASSRPLVSEGARR